jgi:hypothetical protein
VLRRRRRNDVDQPDPRDAGSQDSQQWERDAGSGPWDSADAYPPAERIDCGSLLIPVREGFDVQINIAEEQGAWVAVVHGESGMQLQAFAAPRSGGLWDDVRQEIAANIADSGGSCQEHAGPFGTELAARVPVGEEGKPDELHPVCFVGFDGPRWFLRGVISGPATVDPSLRTPFDDVFGDVVVVRGDYPAPQRQQLEISLPEEVRQAIEEEAAAEDGGWGLSDPFKRGPEITETR